MFSRRYATQIRFSVFDSESVWLRFGRTLALIAGIIFAVLLAIVGGRNIGLLEYQMRRASVKHPFAASPATTLQYHAEACCAGCLKGTVRPNAYGKG